MLFTTTHGSNPTLPPGRFEAASRSVVLHELRETLGDRLFWAGMRHYTRTNFGTSVTAADFQKAMEQSSGKSLSDFFAKWVY
jgi:aminopeptidase N